MNPLLKKSDWILFTCIALAIGFSFQMKWSASHPVSYEGQASYATIHVEGQVYKTVMLTKEPQLIEVRTDKGYDLLRVKENGIEVIESDCPEKVCFTFGRITKPHQVIICLPLRMNIEITGPASSADETGIDAVSY
ncbi:NusG domain II-containing protein [Gorillibacterium sp. CAU 1737]|uniref:NusG domain II-containing protein n=1 Tax=Gorillibacterium sp. CAU 1737 TaxID=3140362 RepID=UPI0032604A87